MPNRSGESQPTPRLPSRREQWTPSWQRSFIRSRARSNRSGHSSSASIRHRGRHQVERSELPHFRILRNDEPALHHRRRPHPPSGCQEPCTSSRGVAISDPEHLLQWLAADRAAVTFKSSEEVRAKAIAFSANSPAVDHLPLSYSPQVALLMDPISDSARPEAASRRGRHISATRAMFLSSGGPRFGRPAGTARRSPQSEPGMQRTRSARR